MTESALNKQVGGREDARICNNCKEEKRLFEFNKEKRGYKGRRSECRECKQSKYKKRAKRKGLEFNLELKDIVVPEYCPVLGIKLEYGQEDKNNSPSIDRIDSDKGYVKGNVQIISWKANRIKSNGSLEDLKNIVNYMEKQQ